MRAMRLEEKNEAGHAMDSNLQEKSKLFKKINCFSSHLRKVICQSTLQTC